jgi:MarR family 2-MHQ and catechol resistance regulon transcriptional repressor
MESTKRYGHRADLALTMWVKLARASAVLAHRTGEQIRTFGLTPAQFGVLDILGHKGPMLLGDLCRKSLVSGGNMTVVVDNLERHGLVERRRGTEDRRAIEAHLTARGKRLFESIFPRHAHYVADLAAVLTEEEQVRLGCLLKKLGTALVAWEGSVSLKRNSRKTTKSRSS